MSESFVLHQHKTSHGVSQTCNNPAWEPQPVMSRQVSCLWQGVENTCCDITGRGVASVAKESTHRVSLLCISVWIVDMEITSDLRWMMGFEWGLRGKKIRYQEANSAKLLSFFMHSNPHILSNLLEIPKISGTKDKFTKNFKYLGTFSVDIRICLDLSVRQWVNC